MKKTINDHLFDQLDRLSDATAETIEFEVKRTQSIVRVSMEVLSVARMKLDVIQAAKGTDDVMNHFAEITDGDSDLVDNDDGKKKLN